jgi:GAF domain-containing protein
MTPCYIDTLASIGVKSNLVVPIILHNGKLLGLLVAHQCFEFRQWQPNELEWARQIAIQCGLALHNARMQEKQSALRGAIDNLATANEQMQAFMGNTSELEQIAGEIRNLSRLLEQEVINSTQKSPAEAQQLLQIIAKRLQRNATKYQDALDRTLPNQQQLSATLTDALDVLSQSKI